MRTFTLLAMLLLGSRISEGAGPIYLDELGAMQAIEKSDPGRYRKIVDILRVSGDVSCETLPGMLQVEFGVAGTQCTPFMVLTSFPPKRHLSFRLGDTDYIANVALRDTGGTFIPAR
jgi:hypothetical protein